MTAGVSWSRAAVKEVGISVSVSREARMQLSVSVTSPLGPMSEATREIPLFPHITLS